MLPSEWEVIVLKPTSLFRNFVLAQLENHITVPDPKTMRTDNTAYIIKKQKNDEETLNEIERHFVRMFQYEIKRWFGSNIAQEIEISFLDFLCCFKFELHSHIVLMEQNIHAGKNLLRIKPKTVLLKWMKSAADEESEVGTVLQAITVSCLAENATVVVKNFNSLEHIKPFLKTFYEELFYQEMQRVCEAKELWPIITNYADFSRYFVIDYHTHLVHLYK